MSTANVIERKSLFNATIDALRARIGPHAWRTGRRIPPEAELAERFGVGRNTIREAIRVLSHSRMLEVRQGDRTYAAILHDSTAHPRPLALTAALMGRARGDA